MGYLQTLLKKYAASRRPLKMSHAASLSSSPSSLSFLSFCCCPVSSSQRVNLEGAASFCVPPYRASCCCLYRKWYSFRSLCASGSVSPCAGVSHPLSSPSIQSFRSSSLFSSSLSSLLNRNERRRRIRTRRRLGERWWWVTETELLSSTPELLRKEEQQHQQEKIAHSSHLLHTRIRSGNNDNNNSNNNNNNKEDKEERKRTRWTAAAATPLVGASPLQTSLRYHHYKNHHDNHLFSPSLLVSRRFSSNLNNNNGEQSPSSSSSTSLLESVLARLDSGSSVPLIKHEDTPRAPKQSASGRSLTENMNRHHHDNHKNTKKNQEEEDYVPLLFRRDFTQGHPATAKATLSASTSWMQEWQQRRRESNTHVHDHHNHKTEIEDRSIQESYETKIQVPLDEKEDVSNEIEVEEASVLAQEEANERQASYVGDHNNKQEEEQDGQKMEPEEIKEQDRRPTVIVVDVSRKNKKLILDPLEWLSQASDAPLMEETVFAPHVSDNVYENFKEGAMNDVNQVEMSMEEDEKEELALPHKEEEAHLPDHPSRNRVEDGLIALSTSLNILETNNNNNNNTSEAHHAALEAAAEARMGDVPLVYNIFTRRITKSTAPSVKALALLGIGVESTGPGSGSHQLRVTDKNALTTLATELRAKRVSWPRAWAHGYVYRQLERLLVDETVADPAAKVTEFLQLQYNRSQQRHVAGLVTSGASGDGENAKSSSSSEREVAHAVEERLLTRADLNAEQQSVVDFVLKGYHTYIGGGAGTGKSVLLRVLRQELVKEGLTVAVTGSTGIAGAQIGGCTLHHCLGISIQEEFLRKKELKAYDVLIIDEVSMLSRSLFEKLEVHLRRANGVELPFGGVQVILCGDFMQLGAIAAQPLITSPIFRRNFAMLKLNTMMRQSEHLAYATQLQLLRRGAIPPGLANLVKLMNTEEVIETRKMEKALRVRQQAQLEQLLLSSGDASSSSPSSPQNNNNNNVEEAEEDRHPYVEGAVNLMPTNSEVHLTNSRELQRLPGESILYQPQFLPPALSVGAQWSPSFILRVFDGAPIKLDAFALEIQYYLHAFYKNPPWMRPGYVRREKYKNKPNQNSSSHNFEKEKVSVYEEDFFSDGAWIVNRQLGERCVVVYPLFVDALVLRVRLPATLDREEVDFLLQYLAQLDDYLASPACEVNQSGPRVRVRDMVASADGMHTEQDEYVLMQHATRAPAARSLELKVGARVMLRTNLAPGLVNGSLGTVVGFRRLRLEDLPRYITGNGPREEAILQYKEFLVYEQGFAEAVIPEVDFGGRVEAIPPVPHYVGGLPHTHYYSVGIVALPLSLAYAFTVHKVQGLTLVGRVHLELSRMWPCEHLLYVAMSRVRNPDQLSISGFDPALVRAAADCLLFDDSVPGVAEVRLPSSFIPATWRRAPHRRKKVLLKKKLEWYAKKRKQDVKKAASRGCLEAEIKLLQEKMLTASVAAQKRREQLTE